MSAPLFQLYDIAADEAVDTFPSREAAEATAATNGIARFAVYRGYEADDGHGRTVFVAELTVAWRDPIMSAA